MGEASGFVVLPALDVLEGRCVRLAGGDREQVTVEGGDPAEAAARFVGEGARFLHLIDLDGAFAGEPTPGLPVLAAGGIGSLEDLRRVEQLGCEGAVVGSALWLGRFSLAEALAMSARRS